MYGHIGDLVAYKSCCWTSPFPSTTARAATTSTRPGRRILKSQRSDDDGGRFTAAVETAPNGYVRVRSRSFGWGRFAALPAMTGRARLRGGARWRVGEGNRRGESGVVIGRRVGEPPARAHRRRQSAPSTQLVCVEILVRASLTHYRARQ